MKTAEAALHRLCDPDPPHGLSPVSCHYLIAEDGRAWQMVDEADRAWHAGQGQWGPVTDVNSRSIGIELANTSSHPFPEPQMRCLEDLLAGLLQRWSIPAERVIGHSDMAPHRKTDPGPRFDWRRLARQGLSVWPEAQDVETAADTARFEDDLHAFGYRHPDCEDPRAAVLGAFRMRFNPQAEDPVTARDAAMARDLAARFPVGPS